jgi:hypothetical protein
MQALRLSNKKVLEVSLCFDSTVKVIHQQEEEKSKLESQLNQSLKNESFDRLAGGVVHNYNNILNVHLGNTPTQA